MKAIRKRIPKHIFLLTHQPEVCDNATYADLAASRSDAHVGITVRLLGGRQRKGV
jgi:hypothetical protein